jgi:hypothetical protein|tara:strand:+ start:191 stop:424 length:234 start_codon:yes stop_codon:yes gene_type:complete
LVNFAIFDFTALPMSANLKTIGLLKIKKWVLPKDRNLKHNKHDAPKTFPKQNYWSNQNNASYWKHDVRDLGHCPIKS